MAGGESLLSREIPQSEVNDQFPEIMTRAGFSDAPEFTPLYHSLDRGDSVTLNGGAEITPPRLEDVNYGIERFLASETPPLQPTIVIPRRVAPPIVVGAHRASPEHLTGIQANLDRMAEENEMLRSYNVDPEDIPPEKDQRKKRGSRVWAAVASLATSAAAIIGPAPSLARAEPSPIQNGEFIEAEGPEQQPGNSITINGLPPNMIMAGNLTSIGYSYGYGAVYGESYQNTSVTNVGALDNVAANTFFSDTGPGRVNVFTAVSPQHQIVDASIYLPKTAELNFLTNPQRLLDSRRPDGLPSYRAGEILKVYMGAENANKAAFVNLTVDGAPPGWFALHTCGNFRGNSTVNTDGKGPKANSDIVKIDPNGYVCVVGDKDAGGIILDKFGIANWDINPAERTIDTRQFGGRIEPNKPWTFEAGLPNALFIGRLTIDRANKAGWVGAYATNKGFGGNSLVNPDGTFATSGLLFLPSDSEGNISLIGDIAGDVIIDQAGIIPLTDLGIDPSTVTSPERVLDTREPAPPTPGQGLTLLSASGKYVGPEDLAISCFYAQGAGEVIRYTVVDIYNQQPSNPTLPNEGATVSYRFTDPELAGNHQHVYTGGSLKADSQGHIGGWSTGMTHGYVTGVDRAQELKGTMSYTLNENTPFQGRINVGESTFAVNIGCPPYSA